jgi:hypothetical protein
MLASMWRNILGRGKTIRSVHQGGVHPRRGSITDSVGLAKNVWPKSDILDAESENPKTASISIKEALGTGSLEILQALLSSEQFPSVAIGDYAWIPELDSAGYTKLEIAQLLSDETIDSPLIFAEDLWSANPAVRTSDTCDINYHVTDCIHKRNDSTTMRSNHQLPSTNDMLIEGIQRLCGIAGNTPFSRDKGFWNGSVQFAKDSQMTHATYAMDDISSGMAIEAALSRSIITLKKLLSAAKSLQESQGCCNSFSIIVHNDVPIFGAKDQVTPVRLRRLEFKKLETLLHETQEVQDKVGLEQLYSLPSTGRRAAVKSLQEAALTVLGILGLRNFPPSQHLRSEETFHIVALAAQVASLAFLSYSQGHVAPIHPFYLDTAQVRVSLLGSYDMPTAPFWILAEIKSLSCLGDMLRSPIIAFSVQR